MILDKLKSILIIGFTQTIAYVFLFLIVPYVYKLRLANIDMDFLIFIGTVIIYVISFVKFPTNILWWLLGIPLMWKLIMSYCPEDLYGISDGGAFGLDVSAIEIDAAVFAINLFLLQCAIKLVLFIKEVIRKRRYPM